MNIYLIRHGRQNSPLCNVDVSLSKEGVKQSRLLGQRLLNYHIDGLYSSHYKRAIETAEIVNESIKVSHCIRENICEISFGDMEGLDDRTLKEKYKDFYTEQKKLDLDIPYPGGECGEDVYNRAIITINEIIMSEHNNVAVVTHGGVIRALLTKVLGLDMSKKLLFGKSLENTSITQLVYVKNEKRFYLERFNDYGHLECDPLLLRKNWLDKY
jgi:broad specificity phosphatase PhoE